MSDQLTPLEILGIDVKFAQKHPSAVVLEVAKSIRHALRKMYHTDTSGEGQALQIPDGLTIGAFQDAYDDIEKNLKKCITDTAWKIRPAKRDQQIAELKGEIRGLNTRVEKLRFSLRRVWNAFVLQKSGFVDKSEVSFTDKQRICYGVQNLNGIAIMVNPGKDDTSETLREYMCHQGAMLARTMIRKNLSLKDKLPPNIPPGLVMERSGTPVAYYDQVSPYETLNGWCVIGSYSQSRLTSLYKQEEAAQKKGVAHAILPKEEVAATTEDTSDVSEEPKDSATTFDSFLASALWPHVVPGNVLMAIVRDDTSIKYQPLGTIASIRIFDRQQRP